MTDQPLERRLLATGYDRDNFPRMDSEGWLPVGLAREAAAEIARLRAELDALRDPQEFKVTLSKQQLPAALEEKQRQVDYWGDRCCKAEAQRDQLLAALKDAEHFTATFGEHAETSPILKKVRAAIAAVEEKP